MTTLKIHIPWSIQTFRGLFANNRRILKKDKIHIPWDIQTFSGLFANNRRILKIDKIHTPRSIQTFSGLFANNRRILKTDKIHTPWVIQAFSRLFAGNRRIVNKNKLDIFLLILIASAAIGIFIFNFIGLLTSDVRVAAPAAILSPVQNSIAMERTGADVLQTSGLSETSAVPPLIEEIPIVESTKSETAAAPPLIKEKPAVVSAKVEGTDRFTIDNHLYRAREYEMKREYSKALASYNKILDIEKSNFIVMNNISYIYLQLDLLKESIEYSIRAITINRDYVPALVNIGIAYAKIGELQSAEYHFARALKLDPANHDVTLNIALFYESQDMFPEASENYLRLVKSGNLNGALGLARVYEKEGRVAMAIKFYKNIYKSGSINVKTMAYVRQRILILQNKQRKTGK